MAGAKALLSGAEALLKRAFGSLRAGGILFNFASSGGGKMYITQWESLTNTCGVCREVSWDVLVDMMLTPRRFEGRDRHPGWSPAEFSPPLRNSENVRRVSALCLDYDGGDKLNPTLAKFENFQGFYHTTRSHTPDRPRFRIVLKLDRDVTPQEFSKLWRVFHAFAGNIDEAPKDPSRFWYMPGVTEGGAFESGRLRGSPLVVDKWLAKAELKRRERVGVAERASLYLAKMESSIAGQGGHQAAWRAALVLVKGFALDEGTAFSLLEEFNERCEPPWSEKELKHKIQSAQRSGLPSGWLLGSSLTPDPISSSLPPEPKQEPEVKHVFLRFRAEAERVWDRMTSPEPEKGFTYGSQALTVRTGGLRRGRITVLGAPTSWGKSSFAAMVYDENVPVGVKVLIVTTEDAPDLYVSRILTRRVMATAARVRDCSLMGIEFQRFASACAVSEDQPFIYNAIGKPIAEVADAIGYACRELGISVVLCDYLQRFNSSVGDRRGQINDVMNQLCDAIKAGGASGIIFSQLRRIYGQEPTLADLKESGDIENMAEIVLLGCGGGDERSVKIAKNKEGSIGDGNVALHFDERSASFYGQPPLVNPFDARMTN